ncbi:MAG: cupin domain-containing protein, partial [Methylotenera sp.]
MIVGLCLIFCDLEDKIMTTITVEHNPSQARLHELGVSSWSTWTKEVSTFPWSYSEREIAYVL